MKGKKFRKHITPLIPAFMLCIMMLIPTKTVWADDADYGKELETGTCGAEGSDITWTVYDSGADSDESVDTGDTLVFTGNGEMADLSDYSKQPWGTYRKKITKIIFDKDSQITSIGNEAFRLFEKLECVTLPNSLRTIGDAAFWSCSNLTEVEIPENVEVIGSHAFGNCQQLKIKVADGNANYSSQDGALYNKEKTTLISYLTASGDVVLPQTVTKIEEQAFSDCKNVQSVILPDGVTDIGKYAFCGCENLKSINIPEGVTTINWQTFSRCAFTSIELPESVTSIGEYAFSGCSALTEISIPESVTSIRQNAFEACTSLSSIVIPNGVTSLVRTFEGCTNLTSITLPSDLTSIGDLTFENCSALTEISIPESVTSIGGSAFENCESLKNITLPNNLTEIGRWAFSGCSALTEISIPESVTSIGGYAFENCETLKNITLPNNLTEIGDRTFENCSALTEISIPESVTSIGMWAFENCTSLENITLPNNLTEIGRWAFSGCSALTELSIPEGVTSIDSDAFENCTSIQYVYYPVALEDVISNVTVPASAVQGSYTVQEDDTVSLTITHLPEGTTDITISETISGKYISSLVYSEEVDDTDITITCKSHYPKDGQWENDKENHWFTECAICGATGKLEEEHQFGNGSQPCKCGYVPFTVTKQPESEELVYGYQEAKKLKVSVTPAYENLEITYQWYENEKAISGATDSTYAIPTGKTVADYKYYCTITCAGYNIKSDNVTVKVLKADYPAVTPDTPTAVDNTVKKVADVPLPEKWQWDEKDADKTLPAGKELEATANYIGEDKECYIHISKIITIQRAACQSSDVLYTGEGEKVPGCTTEGKGHKECTLCKDILETDVIVPALKHTGGTATCKKKAVCDRCKEEYGELDKTNHVETEVKNKKEPTETQKGYTGDVCCKDCGEIISEGTEISALGVSATPSPSVTATPSPSVIVSVSPSVTPNVSPSTTVTPSPSVTASVSPSVTPSTVPSQTPKPSQSILPENTPTPKPTAVQKAPKKGTVLTDKKGKAKYKVVASGVKNGTVEYVKTTNKKAKNITIPAKVTINGITYKVVSVGKNALKNNKKVTKVTIGSNVKKIGNQAFYGCKKLKTITIKSKKLTAKNVGSKAFKGIHSKATIKVPKEKVKTYKKMLKAKGIGSKVKVKK